MHENVLLVQAQSFDEAFKEAGKIAAQEYGQQDDSLTLNGLPAVAVFGGIRKVIECQDTTYVTREYNDEQLEPGHGMEITYSILEVESEEALQKLINGSRVSVIYDE